MKDKIYKIAKNVIYFYRKDICFVKNIKNGSLYSLKFPSIVVWDGLTKNINPEHILSYLRKNNVNECEEIYEAVIKQFKKDKLIEHSDGCYDHQIELYDYICKPELDVYIDKATLVLTGSCNFQCKHCYNTDYYKNKKITMNIDDWKKVIDQLINMGCFNFLITGGEPFLYTDIFEILDYLESKLVSFTINSNGSLITDSHIEKLKNYSRLELLSLSLYGLTEETYEYMCNIKYDPNKLIAKCKMMLEINIPAELKYVTTSLNYDDACKIRDCEKEYNCKISNEYSCLFLYINGKSNLSFNINYDQLKNLYDKGCIVIENNNNPCFKCGMNRCLINYQGNVSMCELLQNIIIGNIIENDLSDIWVESVFRNKMSNQISANLCDECKYKNYCSRCMGLSFNYTKTLNNCCQEIKDAAMNAYNCVQNKHSIT